MEIVGIDPGKSGFLSFLSDDRYWFSVPMPTVKVSKKGTKTDYAVAQLRGLLQELDDRSFVVIEAQQSMPQQGVSSTFTTGRGFGLLEGMCAGLYLPYTIVRAKEWQKVMHNGISGDNPKAKSIIAAGRLFPNVDLRKTERCKNPHDGKADSLLIAEYGRRLMAGDYE